MVIVSGWSLGIQKDHSKWVKPEGRPSAFQTGRKPFPIEPNEKVDLPNSNRKDTLLLQVEGSPSSRLQRKKESTSTSKDSAPQADAATPKAKPETVQQLCIRAAFETITGEPLPKRPKGYSGAAGIVSAKGVPLVEEWVAAVGELGVPEGANAFQWFTGVLRDATSRPWEWRNKDLRPAHEQRMLQPGEAKTNADVGF